MVKGGVFLFVCVCVCVVGFLFSFWVFLANVVNNVDAAFFRRLSDSLSTEAMS